MVAKTTTQASTKPEPTAHTAKDPATVTYDPSNKTVAAAVERATIQVTIKPTKTVRAASLTAGKPYLESETEVENYIARLRDELLAVVKAGNRVRVE